MSKTISLQTIKSPWMICIFDTVFLMFTNWIFRWGWPVIYVIILHPLLGGIACMFWVIVLQKNDDRLGIPF